MIKEVAERVIQLAGSDGWVVVGGIPRVAEHAVHVLARGLPGRVLQLDSLDVHASASEIEGAAQQGASALRNASDLHRVEEIIAHGEQYGLTTLGPAATRRGLEQSQVRELYLTHGYLEEHTADAEDAVRAALDQRAVVEEVSGEAARQLDRYGGLAAWLRYRLAEANSSTETEGPMP